MRYSADRFALHLFWVSVALLVFGYGVAVGLFRIFPHQVIVTAAQGYIDLCARYKIGTIGSTLPWYYTRVKSPYPPAIRNTDKAYPGLNLVTCVAAGRALSVKIMDMDGKTLHQWTIDWSKIWPDAKHDPDRQLPKSPSGAHVNPAILMENGDLVCVFMDHGLVRLDRQGKVVWRLPYQTHHSIERGDNGNLWVCGQKEHTKPNERFPQQITPFFEDTILEVTPEGKIVQEWSVDELLSQNGSTGLLYLGGLNQDTVKVRSPELHLNDVEPFPARLKEGFFKKGDLLVSLRNINTVFAFNRESGKIKFICTGWFLRQHDVEFVDGNTFSVLDNNPASLEKYRPQSRIVIASAPDETVKTFYEGAPEHPFYTAVMGKHQWLPNGDLLITESCAGRAFEVNPRGEIVWEYRNYVDEGVAGLIDKVQRLPSEYAKLFTTSGSAKTESR